MNPRLGTAQTQSNNRAVRNAQAGLQGFNRGRSGGPHTLRTPPVVPASSQPVGEQVVRVLLVEDHPGVSYAVEQVFADEAEFELVASRASARDAIAGSSKVDVVMVDNEQAGQDGLALARTLARPPGAPSVLVYTAYADAWMTVAAVVAGAHGLLSKASYGDELLRAVRVLAKGGRYLPCVARPAIERVIGSLEPAEQSMTNMLRTGVDTGTITRILGISNAELDEQRSAVLKALSSPAVRA